MSARRLPIDRVGVVLVALLRALALADRAGSRTPEDATARQCRFARDGVPAVLGTGLRLVPERRSERTGR
ncbi:MAG TPA: hypothetical protein VNX29_13445 [Kaistia sp.]|nr:hypothetical protein [Kaistia sp.]